MISKHIFSLLRSAVAASGVTIALAAPALAQNWEADHQLRVGAFFQAGKQSFNGSSAGQNFDGTSFALSESRTRSETGFGLTAGAELLRAHGWTFGLEGDFGQSGGTKLSMVNATYAGDYFASMRGRVGFYARQDLVVYGTGGLGFRGVSITDTQGNKVEKTLYGGVYGLGGEWHKGSTILFAEYLHSQYHTSDLTIQGFPAATLYDIGGTSDIFRLGVKFKVGFDNYTDDVRDNARR